jgi:hypothetical protein
MSSILPLAMGGKDGFKNTFEMIGIPFLRYRKMSGCQFSVEHKRVCGRHTLSPTNHILFIPLSNKPLLTAVRSEGLF